MNRLNFYIMLHGLLFSIRPPPQVSNLAVSKAVVPHLNVDQLNIGLMLVSLCLAYYLPFELVLVSYAFLGPAHYLTQISWLHDRTYFTGTKWLLAPMIFVVGLIAFMPWKNHALTMNYSLLCLSASIACALVFAKEWRYRALIFVCLLIPLLAMRFVYQPFAMAIALLLPTVIHIYIFTGSFILLGAIKSGSKWGFLSFAIFVACGLAFFLVAPSDNIINVDFVNSNLSGFDGLADYLAQLLSFGGAVNANSMLGFLSFAYTYHYLNWFSKTEVIKWHLIPPKRWVVISAIYTLSISIYLLDYKAGFVALLFLSLLHVVLEFPLNAITMKTLFAMLFSGRARRA